MIQIKFISLDFIKCLVDLIISLRYFVQQVKIQRLVTAELCFTYLFSRIPFPLNSYICFIPDRPVSETNELLVIIDLLSLLILCNWEVIEVLIIIRLANLTCCDFRKI